MPEEAIKDDSRKLSPNTSEPVGLLLSEALMHLSRNRFIQLASRRWMILLGSAVVVGASYYNSPLVIGILTGMIAGYILLACLYLCWHSWFIKRNSHYKPLCPHCTSRMWQLCCERCREPVPALSLWMRGLFLTHCPHCGYRLSCSETTLLAWCSTCSSCYSRPDLLYFKPTHVIVWITTALPREVKGGWELLGQGEHEIALYHKGDKHSSSIMYIRDDCHSREMPVKEHLINHTRLLLISEGVPLAHAEYIKGYFDITNMTICDVVK